MIDDSPDGSAAPPSRRRFLGTAAAVGTAATAGCVGSLLDTSDSSGNEIEPEEPSDPRKGTPGEFYTLVERNDIPVESLRWDGSDLVLRYSSSASTESESTTEIEVITTVYNENLVKNDAAVDMLYAEVTNPFDGQAYGWGVETEWCERYNAVAAAGEEDGADESGRANVTENETEDDANGTETTESDDSSVNQAAMILMSNVLNTRVYRDDVEN